MGRRPGTTYLQVRHPVLTFTLPLREGFVTVNAVLHSLISGRRQGLLLMWRFSQDDGLVAAAMANVRSRCAQRKDTPCCISRVDDNTTKRLS
jgi:hypothetical protein